MCMLAYTYTVPAQTQAKRTGCDLMGSAKSLEFLTF